MAQQSPALRHRERVISARSAAATESGGVTTGSAYELQLMKLAGDRRTLSEIQSIERKITVKATLLPSYQEWVDVVLAEGNGGQDDVLATVLVWHIDTGDYDRALQIARYAVDHKFTLPDQYSRNVATMLIDEFSGGYSSVPAMGWCAGDDLARTPPHQARHDRRSTTVNGGCLGRS